MIKPDDEPFSIFFNADYNYNINIPISNYDKAKNKIIINSALKQFNFIINKLSQINKENTIEKRTNSNDINNSHEDNSFHNNSYVGDNSNKENNKNSSIFNNKPSKKGVNSTEILWEENTLISYDEKFYDNINILGNEKIDNILL